MQKQVMHVTVVIPVFNEQERIAGTLYTIKDYLSQQQYTFDIIVIDDGSQDLTSEVIRVVDHFGEEVKSQDAATMLHNKQNVGKGYSVAKGLLSAQGDIVVFTDADCATPIEEIDKLLSKIMDGYDVVVGSRNMPLSSIENRPVLRSVTSKSFNQITRLLGLVQLSDSQCGFKAYRQAVARDVAKRQKTFGFCFDVEHIHLARKLGYKVTEVPVQWEHKQGSTLSVLTDSLAMLADLVKIRWIHRKL